MAEQPITWRAPEFVYYEKGVAWNMAVAILVAALIGVALWQRNFLLTVFLAVAGILILYWGSRRPEVLQFTLSEKGLDIGERKLYPMESLIGFAILEDAGGNGEDELVLRTKNTLATFLKIILPHDHRDDVQNFLAASLEEMEYQESLTEYIAKLLKF